MDKLPWRARLAGRIHRLIDRVGPPYLYEVVVGDRTDPEAKFQTVGTFWTEAAAAGYAGELTADAPPDRLRRKLVLVRRRRVGDKEM